VHRTVLGRFSPLPANRTASFTRSYVACKYRPVARRKTAGHPAGGFCCDAPSATGDRPAIGIGRPLNYGPMHAIRLTVEGGG
jgi:hypothetical protein